MVQSPREPTAESVRELVDAVLVFKCGTETFGQKFGTEPRCPYCEGEGKEHLSSCQLAELWRKVSPFIEAENFPDVRPLVFAGREIVFALEGFDPGFCVTCLPLIENLKTKLIPFETIK